MKVAVIGSRSLNIDNIGKYLPEGVTEVVAGGGKGMDSCGREYAKKKGIKVTEFLPEYSKYGRGAPLRRNLEIIAYADEVVAFWDGKSRGTKFVIDNCKKQSKKVTVYMIESLPKNL